MDEWLALDEAALELNKVSKYLVKIASRGEITLTWQPRDFVSLFEINNKSGVPEYIQEVDMYSLDGPLEVSRAGYFNIDLDFCPDWTIVLYDIYLGGTGYGQVFEPEGPLAIKEICPPDEYVFSVTPPPWFKYNYSLWYPTLDTLGVFRKELDRFKNQLVSEIPSKSKSKIQIQGDAILNELNKLDTPFKQVPRNQKDQIDKNLEKNPLFNAESAFKNAWQWLIDEGKIQTH